MKLFILFVIASNLLYKSTGILIENNAIENVYIDTLVQRYLSMESDLWNFIYNSGAKTKDIIFKIRLYHSQFLSIGGLRDVMSENNKYKFGKYLSLTEFENYDQEDSVVIAAEQYHGNINYLNGEKIINIYNKIISDDLFEVIKEVAANQSCDNKKTTIMESASQNIFAFYELITATMLISYAFVQRINMMLVVKLGFEEHDYKFLKNQFNAKYSKIAELARENIQTTNKIVWMCDLDFYTKDDESIQITNFLNGYVDNEINLNKEGSCWNSCEDYKFARNYGCSEGTFCSQQHKIGKIAACNGTIVDCNYIDWSMKICSTEYMNSNRRYEYINYDSGRHFGKHLCDRNKPLEVSSWWNFWPIPMRGDYCFCYCDSDTNSDRYFSLQQAVSTIRKNMVITAVGFVKINGIFSWTIIQSKLMANGRVQQWNYNDENYSYNNDQTVGMTSDDEKDEIIQNFKLSDFGIVEGIDYHRLSWQNRSVNLATITVPAGCAVTGIRFTVTKEHLNMEIRSTPFNFNTGLLYGRSEWISDKNEKRTVLLLDKPEPSVPIHLNNLQSKRSIPDLTPNKFIKFRPSDPDKDAGQTTVPFIDTQMVRPKELALLSGVGIYYKGRPGYGGFIAPKIILYDMSSYLGV